MAGTELSLPHSDDAAKKSAGDSPVASYVARPQDLEGAVKRDRRLVPADIIGMRWIRGKFEKLALQMPAVP